MANLTTTTSFFGNFPYPLIRRNQYGLLESNAPNRGLFWKVIGLPHKFDFIPILDVHTGFPFSRLDRDWNFIGSENTAGRFPSFVGFDTNSSTHSTSRFAITASSSDWAACVQHT
jgi:hypothetical protein